jgi:hypothetical protein
VKAPSRFVIVAAAVALAGCGSSQHAPPERAGQQWCESLRDRGLLFEPMSRCLDEYDDAIRAP